MTVDDALVPLEVVRERFGLNASTIYRRFRAAGVETVQLGTVKAVRWGDLREVFKIGPKES